MDKNQRDYIKFEHWLRISDEEFLSLPEEKVNELLNGIIQWQANRKDSIKNKKTLENIEKLKERIDFWMRWRSKSMDKNQRDCKYIKFGHWLKMSDEEFLYLPEEKVNELLNGIIQWQANRKDSIRYKKTLENVKKLKERIDFWMRWRSTIAQ